MDEREDFARFVSKERRRRKKLFIAHIVISWLFVGFIVTGITLIANCFLAN